MRSSENALRKDKEQKRRKRTRGYVEDVFATKTSRREFAADRNRFMVFARGSFVKEGGTQRGAPDYITSP